MTRMRLIHLVGAAFVSSAVFAVELTSEATFIFVRPETSSFWRTAPSRSLTVPIEWPNGASTATLVVKGLGYEETYTGLTDDSFSFSLPDAAGLESENVYDLTLSFDNGTMRSAKIGLIYGLSPDSEGATRCIAPKTARSWGMVTGGRAVLPVPYGTTSFTVNGIETATGLDGAQGWLALGGIGANNSQSLTLTANGDESTASLYGRVGLFLLIR